MRGDGADSKKKLLSSFTLRPITVAAITQAAIFSHSGLASAPIWRLSLVKADQRHDGEGKLQAQHHLAQHQQLGRAQIAGDADHDHRRHDRQQPRHHAAQPDRQLEVEEPLGDDLPRQRARHRRILPRGEQRHREQHARSARAQHRREQLIGLADLRHVGAPGGVEGRRPRGSGSRR